MKASLHTRVTGLRITQRGGAAQGRGKGVHVLPMENWFPYRAYELSLSPDTLTACLWASKTIIPKAASVENARLEGGMRTSDYHMPAVNRINEKEKKTLRRSKWRYETNTLEPHRPSIKWSMYMRTAFCSALGSYLSTFGDNSGPKNQAEALRAVVWQKGPW